MGGGAPGGACGSGSAGRGPAGGGRGGGTPGGGRARSSSVPWAKMHLSPYEQWPMLTNLLHSFVFSSAGSGASLVFCWLEVSSWATRSGGRTRSSCSPWAKLQCSPSRHWFWRHLACVGLRVCMGGAYGLDGVLDADTGFPVDALSWWQTNRQGRYYVWSCRPLHCVCGDVCFTVSTG